MTILTQDQKDQFWRDGVLVVEDAVTAEQLAALRDVFAGWVEESRNHTEDYGETMDGRPRFDLQPGHSAEVPGLRRVQSPEEVSDVYADVMRTARTVDMCAELIGPNLRFHHGKVNSKLPGTATEVKFHQDFPFQPMTNDDIITCLLFVDDVTLENGPLEVVPGTHTGPIYSHWHGGRFTGAVADAVKDEHVGNAVMCTGKAGSVCLMHARLLHGSAPNQSGAPRTLYISTYYAEDAIELSPNHLPSTLTHEVVRGEASGRVRCTPYEMALPEVPKDTSFFAQQEQG
ncbi:phytanoyl-CoA dioxygenase family protein [Amylibacter sp. IMCC11727]|uniref:phytanoyl-CoA dioxygenase family protein n=1 Tax=Amylibacter sp. IMCC11727 TaxID=3039851 RepID=UPI00244E4813|nr:phytanoyl-CoA dioxygenase family protein [Amylibacter sp. IMCC11727]WGI22752.1 phytanoyl-CoA dioxygenase family protein [Amylibacter sp. IMCC11727]